MSPWNICTPRKLYFRLLGYFLVYSVLLFCLVVAVYTLARLSGRFISIIRPRISFYASLDAHCQCPSLFPPLSSDLHPVFHSKPDSGVCFPLFWKFPLSFAVWEKFKIFSPLEGVDFPCVDSPDRCRGQSRDSWCGCHLSFVCSTGIRMK